MSLCNSIVVAVGRHRSPKSTEATFPRIPLKAHVLVLCAVFYVLAVGTTAISRIGHALGLIHIVPLDYAACLECSNCSNVVKGSSIDMVPEWSLPEFS